MKLNNTTPKTEREWDKEPPLTCPNCGEKTNWGMSHLCHSKKGINFWVKPCLQEISSSEGKIEQALSQERQRIREGIEGMVTNLDEGINTVVKQGERIALKDVLKLLGK